MTELARNIFWSLLTEIIFVGLAVILRDDKRKMVSLLLVGTILAGVIGFGQSVKENVLSLPNISLPKSESKVPQVSPASQEQVVEAIDTIYSYKARGTEKYTDIEGNVAVYQIEEEYVRPNKSHRIEKSEDGQITESIVVGDQFCRRQNGSEWSCNNGAFMLDNIEGWIGIVTGKESFGLNTIIVISHSVNSEIWDGKNCYSYYKTETYTDMNVEATHVLCIDPNTLLPLKEKWDEKWLDNAEIKGVAGERGFFDINAPIDISLP